MLGRNTRMRDDRVIDWLSVGAHNGDDVISAWTHGSWRRAHLKAVRIDCESPLDLIKDAHAASQTASPSSHAQAEARLHTPHKPRRPPTAGSRSPSPARSLHSSRSSPTPKSHHSHHLYSEDPWKLFIGFENAYQLRMREAPLFVPATDQTLAEVELPHITVSHLLSGDDTWPPGSLPDLITRVHRSDVQLHHHHTSHFDEQLSLDLLRAILDLLGWSCFRYRYNYSSNKIQESMQLAQYIDTSILPAEDASRISQTPLPNTPAQHVSLESNFRLNHRFLVLSVHPSTTTYNDVRAQVAGKALITALFKHMAGVSRGRECEVFVVSMRGTRARLWRVVFEPEYLGDVARGLEPVRSAILWSDVSGHVSQDTSSVSGDVANPHALLKDAGEVDLMRHEGRQLLCAKLERVRRIFHTRM